MAICISVENGLIRVFACFSFLDVCGVFSGTLCMLLLTLFFLIRDPTLNKCKFLLLGLQTPSTLDKGGGASWLLGASKEAGNQSDTAAVRVSCHSSRGGDSGTQLLKQLNGDRGAPRERGGLKRCACLWGRHSARGCWTGAKRGPEPLPHEWLTLLSSNRAGLSQDGRSRRAMGPQAE